MARQKGQDDRCAVCGRVLALTADVEVRDDALTLDSSASGLLPVCPECQDDLYYGDGPAVDR